MTDQRELDRRMLLGAARLARRGHGGAEPNPMVGCLLVAPSGRTVGWGYHRTCGEEHAEIVALHRAQTHARGATAYVTLEPCNHLGKTGPCTEQLIRAGITRVVVGRRDPNPVASGGVDRLRQAGIFVDVIDDLPEVTSLIDPFAHRVTTGLPWVIAKWAQTLDGCIATRTGESQWISNEASRKCVHRERGRVDVILTAIGTVMTDDPMLTARHVRTRRIAQRVVIDPNLQILLYSQLVQTAVEFPTHLVCRESMLDPNDPKQSKLIEAGVTLIGMASDGSTLELTPILESLVERFDATNVLVEAGSGLLGLLFQQRLVNEAWVFIAPKLLGDEEAMPSIKGHQTPLLNDAIGMKLIHQCRRGDDLALRYRVDS
ncbi:MAG: bifunctional diaminohydroxyphosphoribosylaminopyrimidine deaminase/5-amino-6-(5-phosphoribosylamino)uracil reductase RibD [Planctomycetota bacterium]|nr:bifunctional diaminohydroxyphosphoribosylaminopyrimidine deaminase/5-amino-6-(5-phosphoribosylamino)uracil reductase RibD [Planctomycetota bacterium]